MPQGKRLQDPGASHNAPRGLWGFHWQGTHRLLFAAGRESPRGASASAVWRMEQGGLWPPVFGRAQEQPPLSSRWSLLIDTGYKCRRPLRSCRELPVLSQLEHGVRLRRPLLCCLLLAVLGGGRSGSGHGRRRIDQLWIKRARAGGGGCHSQLRF
jgi:hypothetical protein